MCRKRLGAVLVAGLVAAASWSVHAEVRTDQKSRVEFAGALGKIINFFGGKAAKEGVASSIAVKGDRKATMYEERGQIIDLAEEKVYDLDLKKKTYKVTTFDEIRRKLEEDRRKAEEQAKKEQSKEQSKEKAQPDKNAKEMEVDFDVKETGQKKAINGFDTREVVMTIAIREKGKTLEQSGGLVLTSDMWMAPRVAAMKEIAEFEMRYAQKIAGPMLEGTSPEQMAMALAQYPQMKDAIARMRAEGTRLDGTPILTTTTFDAVKSPEQMAQEKSEKSSDDDAPSASGGVGGMLGGFARKAMKKKSDSADEAPKARQTVMTMNAEVLKIAPTVSAAELAIPADYKQR